MAISREIRGQYLQAAPKGGGGVGAKWRWVLQPGTQLPLAPGQLLPFSPVAHPLGKPIRITPQQSLRVAERQLENLKGGTARRYGRILNEIDELEAGFGLSLLTYDNLTTTTQQYKDYIRDVARFVSLHAGGIIGDHIKDHYFNAGKPEWPGLSSYTIEKKLVMNVPEGARRPYPQVPMWGLTGLNTGLPDNWHQYTYKYGDYKGGGITGGRSAAFMFKMPSTAAGIKGIRGSRFLTRKDYPKGSYGAPYANPAATEGIGRAYAPEHRAFLMDTVAAVAPLAEYINARGAKHRGLASDEKGRIKVYNIFESFAQVPYVFSHEKGYETYKGHKVPARPFLVPGFTDGINDVQRLIKLYLNEGTDNIKKAIRISSKEMYSAAAIDYYYGIKYERYLAKKYGGLIGVKVPNYIVFTSRYDAGKVTAKTNYMKKLLKGMSGTRAIWWFLPPSKYYHYIGMTFDLYSIATGGFWSLGAVAAMMKAMTVGIIGARMGSPVPFTKKAQRRKFRKGLYTRAGYHREGSLGTGRRGR